MRIYLTAQFMTRQIPLRTYKLKIPFWSCTHWLTLTTVFQCRSNNRLQSIFSLSIQHTFINFSFKFRSTKHGAFISPRDIHFQCFLLPDFTNQAWLQSWNETRSRGSDEPGPHLRCHRDECDWQLFSGSFRWVGWLLWLLVWGWLSLY